MSAATLSSDLNPHTAIVQQGTRDRPTISWAAVIAGVAVSMATQLGLAELCLAAGLSLYTPFDPDSSPGKAGAVAVIAALVCMIAALFLGGWVAGRLAHFHSRTVASLHGLLVWALGALLAAALLASTLGMLAGGALSMVGDGLKGAATAVPAVAKLVAPSIDDIRTQVKDGIAKAGATAAPGANDNRFADQSRLTSLLGSAFTMDGKPMPEDQQQELLGLLSSQLGISREAAQKAMTQWQSTWKQAVDKYQAAKQEAEDKAKAAAVAARNYTMTAAAAGFALMLIGAVAAGLGGLSGAATGRRDETLPTAVGRPALT
jgi:hypothetical protein